MNFLAHCYLSCPDEDILIGNLLADFLTNKELLIQTPEIVNGVTLHRKIDSFTDMHPSSRALRKLLRPGHKKYAPVVVDLLWDYCLSLSWGKYAEVPLEAFVADIYQVIEKYLPNFPLRIQSRFRSMIEHDFLSAYASEGRALKSLEWMDKRAKFDSNFKGALSDYHTHEQWIKKEFDIFFNDLIAYVEKSCLC